MSVEFTLIGLVYDVDTNIIHRVIYPTGGDFELDDPEILFSNLDPVVNWAVKKIANSNQDFNILGTTLDADK